MARKKKQPSITRRIFKGIFRTTASTLKFTGRKMRKANENRRRKKSPIYNSPANFEDFKIIKKVEGEYNEAERKLLEDSLIMLIFGKRGSGKSALGFKILENIHARTQRHCYALNLGKENLPKWISPIKSIENVPNNSAVLIDESALSFSSRESMSSQNKTLGKLMAIARHKDLTLLFVTQNTGMIDKNILKLVDTIMVKEGSLLQLKMERPEMRDFYEKAKSHLKSLKGEKRRYVYLIDSDFEGVVGHSLPTFWSENLSKNRAE